MYGIENIGFCELFCRQNLFQQATSMKIFQYSYAITCVIKILQRKLGIMRKKGLFLIQIAYTLSYLRPYPVLNEVLESLRLPQERNMTPIVEQSARTGVRAGDRWIPSAEALRAADTHKAAHKP